MGNVHINDNNIESTFELLKGGRPKFQLNV